MNLDEKFKQIVEHRFQISPEDFNKKFSNILPKPEDYKNIDFESSISEMGFNADKIFDPIIKRKVINLLKQDAVRREKFEKKEHKKKMRESKKFLSQLEKRKTPPDFINIYKELDDAIKKQQNEG